MIDRPTLILNNWKCFESDTLELAPITVLTGVNSGGKTSILQSLILSKGAYHDFKQSARWNLAEGTLGGLATGNLASFSRTGSPHGIALIEDGNFSFSVQVSDILVAHRMPGDDFPLLSKRWRISPTTMLPLMTEQSVEKRDLESDTIWDHGHALLDLSLNELKRKPGSGAASVPLRTAVERLVSSVTVETQIEVVASEFPGKLKLSYRGASLESESSSPAQYGAGVTAALPLAIHLCSATSGETIICQDPEMHLHPRGQSLLGREFASAVGRGVRIVIETHSEHIINGIKLGLIARRASIQDNLACYYLSQQDGRAIITEVEFDESGRTRKWPNGYFDQAERDFIELTTGKAP